MGEKNQETLRLSIWPEQTESYIPEAVHKNRKPHIELLLHARFDKRIALIELEITACIIIRDDLNHTGQSFVVVGEQSPLNIIAQQIAEQATEILVARIA